MKQIMADNLRTQVNDYSGQLWEKIQELMSELANESSTVLLVLCTMHITQCNVTGGPVLYVCVHVCVRVQGKRDEDRGYKLCSEASNNNVIKC